jgi:hypothetical protein
MRWVIPLVVAATLTSMTACSSGHEDITHENVVNELVERDVAEPDCVADDMLNSWTEVQMQRFVDGELDPKSEPGFASLVLDCAGASIN